MRWSFAVLSAMVTAPVLGWSWVTSSAPRRWWFDLVETQTVVVKSGRVVGESVAVLRPWWFPVTHAIMFVLVLGALYLGLVRGHLPRPAP